MPPAYPPQPRVGLGAIFSPLQGRRSSVGIAVDDDSASTLEGIGRAFQDVAQTIEPLEHAVAKAVEDKALEMEYRLHRGSPDGPQSISFAQPAYLVLLAIVGLAFCTGVGFLCCSSSDLRPRMEYGRLQEDESQKLSLGTGSAARASDRPANARQQQQHARQQVALPPPQIPANAAHVADMWESEHALTPTPVREQKSAMQLNERLSSSLRAAPSASAQGSAHSDRCSYTPGRQVPSMRLGTPGNGQQQQQQQQHPCRHHQQQTQQHAQQAQQVRRLEQTQQQQEARCLSAPNFTSTASTASTGARQLTGHVGMRDMLSSSARADPEFSSTRIVSREEFCHIASSWLGYDVAPEDANALFDEFDAEQRGAMSYLELLQALGRCDTAE